MTTTPLARSARDCLQEAGPVATEAMTPLRVLVDQNRRLKRLTIELYRHLLSIGADKAAGATFLQLAARQGERELAFFRMTGFAESKKDLETMLAEQGDFATIQASSL